jgi:hypothetical protein
LRTRKSTLDKSQPISLHDTKVPPFGVPHRAVDFVIAGRAQLPGAMEVARG